MDGRAGSWLRLLTLLYLCALPAAAYSKCKGRWAIHSCFGGNGKRSDPGLELGMDVAGDVADSQRSREEQGGLLHRLFSRPPYLQMADFPDPQDAAPLSPLPAPYPPQSPLGEREAFSPDGRRVSSRDSRRLRSMLRTLMLERQLRADQGEDELA